ncbi:MAG: hypothetical protein LBH79_03085 [Nitrososphaerota archaeon]|jgi:hypothetical protein|nr:hypothetical protein [Nitrososphaerota archaeon]
MASVVELQAQLAAAQSALNAGQITQSQYNEFYYRQTVLIAEAKQREGTAASPLPYDPTFDGPRTGVTPGIGTTTGGQPSGNWTRVPGGGGFTLDYYQGERDNLSYLLAHGNISREEYDIRYDEYTRLMEQQGYSEPVPERSASVVAYELLAAKTSSGGAGFNPYEIVENNSQDRGLYLYPKNYSPEVQALKNELLETPEGQKIVEQNKAGVQNYNPLESFINRVDDYNLYGVPASGTAPIGGNVFGTPDVLNINNAFGLGTRMEAQRITAQDTKYQQWVNEGKLDQSEYDAWRANADEYLDVLSGNDQILKDAYRDYRTRERITNTVNLAAFLAAPVMAGTMSIPSLVTAAGLSVGVDSVFRYLDTGGVMRPEEFLFSASKGIFFAGAASAVIKGTGYVLARTGGYLVTKSGAVIDESFRLLDVAYPRIYATGKILKTTSDLVLFGRGVSGALARAGVMSGFGGGVGYVTSGGNLKSAALSAGLAGGLSLGFEAASAGVGRVLNWRSSHSQANLQARGDRIFGSQNGARNQNTNSGSTSLLTSEGAAQTGATTKGTTTLIPKADTTINLPSRGGDVNPVDPWSKTGLQTLGIPIVNDLLLASNIAPGRLVTGTVNTYRPGILGSAWPQTVKPQFEVSPTRNMYTELTESTSMHTNLVKEDTSPLTQLRDQYTETPYDRVSKNEVPDILPEFTGKDTHLESKPQLPDTPKTDGPPADTTTPTKPAANLPLFFGKGTNLRAMPNHLANTQTNIPTTDLPSFIGTKAGLRAVPNYQLPTTGVSQGLPWYVGIGTTLKPVSTGGGISGLYNPVKTSLPIVGGLPPLFRAPPKSVTIFGDSKYNIPEMLKRINEANRPKPAEKSNKRRKTEITPEDEAALNHWSQMYEFGDMILAQIRPQPQTTAKTETQALDLTRTSVRDLEAFLPPYARSLWKGKHPSRVTGDISYMNRVNMPPNPLDQPRVQMGKQPQMIESYQMRRLRAMINAPNAPAINAQENTRIISRTESQTRSTQNQRQTLTQTSTQAAAGRTQSRNAAIAAGVLSSTLTDRRQSPARIASMYPQQERQDEAFITIPASSVSTAVDTTFDVSQLFDVPQLQAMDVPQVQETETPLVPILDTPNNPFMPARADSTGMGGSASGRTQNNFRVPSPSPWLPGIPGGSSQKPFSSRRGHVTKKTHAIPTPDKLLSQVLGFGSKRTTRSSRSTSSRRTKKATSKRSTTRKKSTGQNSRKTRRLRL